MSAMPGMEMPGGWTMSMAWMRMPDQSWPGAAATFLGMWAVMMIAMMLPSLVPMLARYRRASSGAARLRLGQLTAMVGAAYFAVWIALGLITYPLGLALAEAVMRVPALSRVVPFATAVVVLLAGILQFTRWKAHQLACCRVASGCCDGQRTRGSAWRHGLRLGIQCVRCCLGPTAALLVLGVMDLLAMSFVAAAISAERLAPASGRVANAIGTALIAYGLWLMGAGWYCAA
jgi:predicted metal-binding membrane protein